MEVRFGLGCRFPALAGRRSQRNDPCINAASVVVEAVHDEVAGLADRYGVSSTPRGRIAEELKRKITAIFKHQSQKDKALFPGPDEREFWQRAEERNRGTAAALDALGFAEYEAVEAFVKWDGRPLD